MPAQIFSKISRLLILTAAITAISACSKFKSSDDDIDGTLITPPCPAVGSTGLCSACDTKATLTWTAPTTDTNGNPLSGSEALVGFNLYYGNTVGAYSQEVNIPSPTTTSTVISNLSPATYYFVVTSYIAPGGAISESAQSNSAGIELQSCANAKINMATGKVTYEPLEPRIIDAKITGIARSTN
jgi:hypothetical protein